MFRHLTTCLLLALFVAPLAAQKEQARWMKTDLGPVFSSTIDGVPKGIAVRIGDKGEAAVLYDEDLLCMTAAWTGGFVNIDPGRDALLGNDRSGGDVQFRTPRIPGWADGDGSFDDPRPGRQGPLPRGHAKYRGLYMHGDRVVLSYTVGGVEVKESPWAATADGLTVFERQLVIGPRKHAMKLLLADGGKGGAQSVNNLDIITAERGGKLIAAAAIGAEGVAKPVTGDNRIALEIAPGDQTLRFRVFIAACGKDQLPAFANVASADRGRVNLDAYTKGGPRRWTKTLTTQATLGKEDGPYVVDTITPPFDNPYNAIMHFGGFDFFSNGDAAICTMEGDVWLVRGIKPGEQLKETTWQRIATGMYHPLGLKIVKDKIYVLCRDQIARLHDLNGDNEIDFYECFNNDCHVGTNGHEFATCLETDPQGNFYYMKGNNGGRTEHDASVIRVSADGATLERFATGFRWPNGMGMSPGGILTAADQQGDWVPSSRLDVIERGGFYGFMSSHHRAEKPETYDGPLCWIPHSVDNSCGGQVWVDSDKWGPLKGQMLHLSYGKCVMFNVLSEKLEGVPGKPYQGGVVQFPLRFTSGIHRGRFSPFDGQLYLCGLKGWQTSGPYDGCFQRVRYTGKKVHMPIDLRIRSNGVSITFTEPLHRELAEDESSYEVSHWNYQWTKGYGSKEYSVADPNQVGHDKLNVKSAKLSRDGKTVTLEIEGIQPVMQMQIKYDLESTDGEVIRQSIYNTIHKLGGASE